MEIFFIFYIVLYCLLQSCEAMDCPLLNNCTLQLQKLISEAVDSKIHLCLNVVDKQSRLRRCEQEAVHSCELGGHEKEYQLFAQSKYKAVQQCFEDCPNMNEVKLCQNYIKYDTIPKLGYAGFCRNYREVQTTCVDKKLNNCTFKNQLFESGLSEDGRHIVQTICQSGCASIDETMKSIETCNKDFSINGDCSSYKNYVSCIQSKSVCPEFRKVVQYSQPDVFKIQSVCEPTAPSTSGTTMAMTTTDNTPGIDPTDHMATTFVSTSDVAYKIFTPLVNRSFEFVTTDDDMGRAKSDGRSTKVFMTGVAMRTVTYDDISSNLLTTKTGLRPVTSDGRSAKFVSLDEYIRPVTSNDVTTDATMRPVIYDGITTNGVTTDAAMRHVNNRTYTKVVTTDAAKRSVTTNGMSTKVVLTDAAMIPFTSSGKSAEAITTDAGVRKMASYAQNRIITQRPRSSTVTKNIVLTSEGSKSNETKHVSSTQDVTLRNSNSRLTMMTSEESTRHVTTSATMKFVTSGDNTLYSTAKQSGHKKENFESSSGAAAKIARHTILCAYFFIILIFIVGR